MRSRLRSLDLLLTAILLVLLIVISDFTDGWWRGNISRMTWLVLDTSLQTLISMMVAAPLLNHPFFSRRLIPWLIALVAVIAVLDLDHFVAAGSLRLDDALQLDYRPVSHSLGFVLIVGLASWAISRQWLLGMLFFIGLSAHVLHDVQNSGAPFFWPLSNETIFLPFTLYIFLNLVLLFLAAGIAAAANRRPIWSSGFFLVVSKSFQQLTRRYIAPDE
jgi:membrane-bound metal-dependent hydrolase YbcI (DUF457 family)